MKINDAAKILGLSGAVTPAMVKDAYRLAAKTYHPDHNPAGMEMMKLVNAAYDVLRDYAGDLEGEADPATGTYPEALNDALNAIIGLDGLMIEVCGAWVWVTGQTRQHKETLKGAGFRFASKKKAWYFRPEDWRSSSRGRYSLDDIRGKYGSIRPQVRRDRLEDETAA